MPAHGCVSHAPPRLNLSPLAINFCGTFSITTLRWRDGPPLATNASWNVDSMKSHELKQGGLISLIVQHSILVYQSIVSKLNLRYLEVSASSLNRVKRSWKQNYDCCFRAQTAPEFGFESRSADQPLLGCMSKKVTVDEACLLQEVLKVL